MPINKITALSILILLFFSCSENSLNPEPEPGKRNYEWTIDTIKTYPTFRLWGNSPEDIWIITTSGNLNKSIFHFNGKSWSTDGIFRLLNPRSIWGFSKSNVYIGGINGDIWHYDGNNWDINTKLTKDGRSDIVFDNMWGQSKNDIYASGAYVDMNGYANNSIIAYYSGSWKISNTTGLIGIVERVYRNCEDKKIYVLTYRYGFGEHPDSSIIFEFSNDKYKRIYSSVWTQGQQADLSIINEEVYFILGNRIALRLDNHFETLLEVNNSNFYQRIWGTNSKNIFLFMTNGLAHFNGTDIEYLFYFSKQAQIYGAALFKNNVFFLVNESSTALTLIYHGIIQ